MLPTNPNSQSPNPYYQPQSPESTVEELEEICVLPPNPPKTEEERLRNIRECAQFLNVLQESLAIAKQLGMVVVITKAKQLEKVVVITKIEKENPEDIAEVASPIEKEEARLKQG